MTDHHLKSRKVDPHLKEPLCKECHKVIHGLFPIKAIRDSRNGLDSVDGLLAQPEVQKALVFVRKLPAGCSMRMRKSGERRRQRR